MNKSTLNQSILHASIEDFLYIFLTEKYISNPNTLGLHNFSINELTEKLFLMEGDKFYCLYEKIYKLENSNSCVNIKNYFHDNKFISNGLDLTNGRVCTILSNFQKKYGESAPIHSIELLLDDSLNYGSLILNEFLDIRFSKLKKPKRKKKFHLTGISTDYELPSNGINREVNTRGARMMKEHVYFRHASEKFKDNPAIKELVMFVIKKYPHALR